MWDAVFLLFFGKMWDADFIGLLIRFDSVDFENFGPTSSVAETASAATCTVEPQNSFSCDLYGGAALLYCSFSG